MKKESIKAYWDNQAEVHKTSHVASWGDNWMINLEIENISKFINEGDDVLDIGCANGFSSMKYLDKKPKHLWGIDYSESMIRESQKNKKENGLGDEIHFKVGDILDIPFDDAQFDVAFTTRVIINLPSWELQQKAIEECLRVVKPGGKLVFSEAFLEPMQRLNGIRNLCGLSPLKEHEFNRYMLKSELKAFLTLLGFESEVIDFSSVYYLGSRFLRELVTDPSAYPGYSNPINKIFYEIEKDYSGGDFGIQQAFVVRK